jgi:hypothetical protein
MMEVQDSRIQRSGFSGGIRTRTEALQGVTEVL